jgi:hypothetical protein
MSIYGQQIAADGSDVLMVDTGTSPSGASLTGTVRGFPVDTGAVYADFNAKSTIVGGLTPFH